MKEPKIIANNDSRSVFLDGSSHYTDTYENQDIKRLKM